MTQWQTAQSTEIRETERLGEKAVALWAKQVGDGVRRPPTPDRIIPILDPQKPHNTLSVADRITASVVTYDHAGEVYGDGWIAVFNDELGNTLECHCWHTGNAQLLARAWYLVVPVAEAEAIEQPVAGDAPVTLREDYVMATTTTKKPAAKKTTSRKPAAKKKTGRPSKYQVFGKYPVTSVIRFMGANELSVPDAKAALAHLVGAKKLNEMPSITTVRIQLGRGRRGETPPPATLTQAEGNQILRFKGKGEEKGAGSKPKAAKKTAPKKDAKSQLHKSDGTPSGSPLVQARRAAGKTAAGSSTTTLAKAEQEIRKAAKKK